MLALYLCVQIPVGQAVTRSFHEMGEYSRRVVFGVLAFTRNQPDRMLLLKGVDDAMFLNVIYNRPFRLFGLNDVYLVPNDRPNIPSSFFADPVAIHNAAIEHRLIVLDMSSSPIREVTADYRKKNNN